MCKRKRKRKCKCNKYAANMEQKLFFAAVGEGSERVAPLINSEPFMHRNTFKQRNTPTLDAIHYPVPVPPT
jgi:hypothetical protein